MAEVLERSPKGPHVSFAHQTHLHTIPANQAIRQSENTIDPSTPPRTSNDLPTPPDSHIDISHHTHPSTTHISSSQPPGIDASTLQTDHSETSLPSAIEFDQSPSIEVHQRRAKRTSAGSTSNNKEADDEEIIAEATSSPMSIPASNVVSERQAVLAEAEQRGRRRNKSSQWRDDPEDAASSRSRTPSPILGSVVNSNGRLSFAASFIPSAEEVRSLLYSPDGDKDVDLDEERSSIVKKEEIDGLLKRLASMGLTDIDDMRDSSNLSREQELASMVKKLVSHSKQQDRYIDSIDKTLHKTRIRSISLLTSLQTTFAHTLASEYGLRARVESELEGARLQAKKLSVMLARSESRNEEIDRERAMSAEEEVLWQEEMKDHASAYAQQQAARARASQMAYAQSQGQKVGNINEGTKTEPVAVELDSAGAKEGPASGSSQVAGGKVLEEPFEERRDGDEGLITGLGISSSGVAADGALNLSPLSTIVKERNKLLSDKRHLKSRIRDVEAQRDRLEVELKSMRPLLVRGGASKNAAASHAGVSAIHNSPSSNMTPSTPGKAHKRDRSKRRKQATMGDAEAEHLLLAARRLKEISKLKNIDEDGRPRTPPPGVAASALPRTPKTPRTTTTTSATPKSTAGRETIESIHQSGLSSRLATNGSPIASRNTGPASLGRWGAHERTDSNVSASGIDDLLHAAQTVLTPEKKAAHKQSHSRSKSGAGAAGSDEEDVADGDKTLTSKMYQGFTARDFAPLNGSPKRRRVSTAGAELDRSRRSWDVSSDRKGLAAAFQGAGIRRGRTSTEGAEPQASQNSALSALDLLADQAAASQHPSQSSDPSHSGEGEHVMEPDDFGSDYDDEIMADEEEEEEEVEDQRASRSTMRPMEEGLIGSHQYPRGAYGHPYAQQPNSLPFDLYRSPNMSGYTYSSAQHTPINSQGSWSTPHGLTNTPRNGMYGPGSNSSPPMNGTARFSGPTPAYHSPHRLSTGTINPSYHPSSQMSHGHLEDGNRQGDHRNMQKGGNTSPDKRLPYVRWSDEEDQKLKKAIQEHGQRWESVARVVGTRSYHQCRQRYLLMRRKEAAAREGNTSEDARSTSHQVAA